MGTAQSDRRGGSVAVSVLRDHQRGLVAVVSIVAAAYLLLAVRFLDRLDPLTGDEPFYVMTAISLLRDGDLDESNNYENRDYDEFYPDDPLPANWNGWPSFPRTLPPHPATTDRSGVHTKHGLGLSLLIGIPYEIAGRIGAVSVILICALLVVVNMYLLAQEVAPSDVWAAAVTTMLALAMPIAPYALLLFPEIPAALLIIFAIRRLASGVASGSDWILTGLAIGFLPWLHQRFAPTAVVLTAVVLYRVWHERSWVALASLLPIAAGGFSLIGYNLWLYSSPLQDTADHAGFNSLSGTVNAAFGLLLDAQWGLLIASPVYLLALIAIPRWAQVSATARLAVISLVPYLVVVAAYNIWWGEWGPAARYLVPVAPLAAGPLALLIARAGSYGRSAVVALWGVSMGLMTIGLSDPQRFYHHPNGINNLYSKVDDSLGTNLAGHLVAFQPLSPSPVADRILAAILLVGISLVAYVLFMVSTTRQSPREDVANHN